MPIFSRIFHFSTINSPFTLVSFWTENVLFIYSKILSWAHHHGKLNYRYNLFLSTCSFINYRWHLLSNFTRSKSLKSKYNIAIALLNNISHIFCYCTYIVLSTQNFQDGGSRIMLTSHETLNPFYFTNAHSLIWHPIFNFRRPHTFLFIYKYSFIFKYTFLKFSLLFDCLKFFKIFTDFIFLN